MTKIPYKINLSEDELPKYWQNIRPYMQEAPDPFINPVTFKPCTADDLRPVFCDELIEQELDNTNKFIEIPEEIRDFYKMYRPSPLTRAYNLEKALGTPAEIYYKFEGTNTSGSHKLNSAVAQVYYAKQQGLTHLTTETGAGQWGTALSMACGYFGIDLSVYMVKVSAEQKPYRKAVMETYGARVIPSPSDTTEVGRRILAENPGTGGSLGCAISEAMEVSMKTDNCRYVLGSVLNHVVLHQSIIGLETKLGLDKYGVQPDIMTCAKALGCGVPVGAFLMTERVAEKSLAPGDHGTTYGGNPFVGAAVDTVLKMMERDRITEHVKEITPYLEQKLDALVEKYDFLTARRGLGLMQGVVCEKPVGKIASAALEHGLVVITAGADVLRFVPPLIIGKEHVDEMAEKLDAVLAEM